MTLSEINSRISFYTNASTTQYASTDRLVAINKAIDDVQTMILQSQDEWQFDDKNKTNQPIQTTNIVADQSSYALPADCLKVQRLEISYDGTNWKKVHPIDINENPNGTSTADIKSDFSQENPYYDLNGTSFFLYPIPSSAVEGGLKIWTSRTMSAITSDELTAGTKSPGFDRQFHDMVAISVSLDWAIAKGKENINFLQNKLAEYEQRLKQYYGDKQVDRVYKLGSAYSEADYN